MSITQPDVTLERPAQQGADMEQSVLGAILINNHPFYRVIGTIDTEDLFEDPLRTIFAAMRGLTGAGRRRHLPPGR